MLETDAELAARYRTACVERRRGWSDSLIDIAAELAEPNADTPRLRARLNAIEVALSADREGAPEPSDQDAIADGEDDYPERRPIDLEAELKSWLASQAEDGRQLRDE